MQKLTFGRDRLEGDHRARQQPHGNRGRGAHADFAHLGTLDCLHIVARVAQFRFDGLGAVQQRFTSRGRGDPVRAAMQHFCAQLLLQLLDTLADRRLR